MEKERGESIIRYWQERAERERERERIDLLLMDE